MCKLLKTIFYGIKVVPLTTLKAMRIDFRDASINTELLAMTITKRLGITLTPLRLHAASTVRIPHSTNNFQN